MWQNSLSPGIPKDGAGGRGGKEGKEWMEGGRKQEGRVDGGRERGRIEGGKKEEGRIEGERKGRKRGRMPALQSLSFQADLDTILTLASRHDLLLPLSLTLNQYYRQWACIQTLHTDPCFPALLYALPPARVALSSSAGLVVR